MHACSTRTWARPSFASALKPAPAKMSRIRLWLSSSFIFVYDAWPFIVDDGGHKPITVVVNALADPIADLPEVNTYVGVTGLAGYAPPGLLAVRPRSGLDIQIYCPSTPP